MPPALVASGCCKSSEPRGGRSIKPSRPEPPIPLQLDLSRPGVNAFLEGLSAEVVEPLFFCERGHLLEYLEKVQSIANTWLKQNNCDLLMLLPVLQVIRYTSTSCKPAVARAKSEIVYEIV